jgi:hypothetical protein
MRKQKETAHQIRIHPNTYRIPRRGGALSPPPHGTSSGRTHTHALDGCSPWHQITKQSSSNRCHRLSSTRLVLLCMHDRKVSRHQTKQNHERTGEKRETECEVKTEVSESCAAIADAPTRATSPLFYWCSACTAAPHVRTPRPAGRSNQGGRRQWNQFLKLREPGCVHAYGSKLGVGTRHSRFFLG